jgi:hypothetical protein
MRVDTGVVISAHLMLLKGALAWKDCCQRLCFNNGFDWLSQTQQHPPKHPTHRTHATEPSAHPGFQYVSPPPPGPPAPCEAPAVPSAAQPAGQSVQHSLPGARATAAHPCPTAETCVYACVWGGRGGRGEGGGAGVKGQHSQPGALATSAHPCLKVQT